MRVREPFEQHVPPRGWIRKYYEWTLGSEAPAPFHFFVGCAVLGAAFGRNVYFSKGYYKLYPNLQILLVGPTGRVRKTSAINLGLQILRALGNVNVVSDKTTPEALVDALDVEPQVDDGKYLAKRDSIAVLAAPELAVLLGKQKYNEGMIALLTSLFDSPDEWTYKTRGRGEIKLRNVTITMLGASTPDWLITAIPQDAFGGGFMSRLLFVVQENTERCYPIPEPPSDPAALVDDLRRLLALSGEVKLTQRGYEWYVMWYAASRKDVPEDEKMAGYHERKPDHLLRLAMILALSEGKREVDEEQLLRASRALVFLENEMLLTFRWLGMRPIGQDQERIVRTLRAHGGRMEHGDLLRRLIFFMNAPQFANAMRTLIESRVVRQRITPQSHIYELTEEDGEQRAVDG